MRNAKTYDKHISEREQKRMGGRGRVRGGGKRLEKRGCSGGSRIMGFSYFRPWMASRIAESRKWRTRRAARINCDCICNKRTRDGWYDNAGDKSYPVAFSRIHARENRWRNWRRVNVRACKLTWNWLLPRSRVHGISISIFGIPPRRNLVPILQFYHLDINFSNYIVECVDFNLYS